MTEAILKVKNFVWVKKRRGFAVAALKNIKIETLNVALILSIVALAAAYLASTNIMATAAYQKTMLQRTIDGVKMEIMNINLELSEKRSIGFLKKAAEALNLVVSEDIQYIKVIGPVASNSLTQ